MASNQINPEKKDSSNNLNLSDVDWKPLSREERGFLISQRFRIKKTEKGYVVPSQSGAGNYLVKIDSTSEKCDCHDYELRRNKCKHIFAVEYILRGESNKEGSFTITKEV